MSEATDRAGAIACQISDTFTARDSVYGPPEVNFANIANFWNAWIKARHPESNVALDGTDVAHMSALIKKARLAESPQHLDSALDDATYTLLGAGVACPLFAVDAKDGNEVATA